MSYKKVMTKRPERSIYSGAFGENYKKLQILVTGIKQAQFLNVLEYQKLVFPLL